MNEDSSFAKFHRAWERFTATNEIDSEIIRDEVARSWMRCSKAGLDPQAPKAPVRLSTAELADLLQNNRDYLEAAIPFMKFPESAVRGTGFILALTDAQGIVLEVFGDADITMHARANNYVPGCCRSEEEVGTNSIGLAMIERRAVQLSGPEHYNVRHHSWTCASAPVFCTDGEFLGTVTLSGQSMSAHRHTLGLVIAASEGIQNRLRERRLEAEKWRSDKLTESLLRWTPDAVITLNANCEIVRVNKAAETLLNCAETKLSGMTMSTIFAAPELVDVMDGRSDIPAFEAIFKVDGNQSSVIVKPLIMRQEDGVHGAILTITRREISKGSRGHADYRARHTFDSIVGTEETIRRQIDLAKLLAQQETRVLITGETGTGKELVAQSIHVASRRARSPFVAINCAAIPKDLLEAELFGYREGAFTGARKGGQIGKVEIADTGTLFLDEISLMPLELQAKLLRVLEDGIITRLGDSAPIRVDLRIIAATNDNLFEMGMRGTFRKDLYFRLGVAEVSLPPLRQRIGDLPALCDFILGHICGKMGRPKASISPRALDYLARYDWPGNIRELENVLEISILLAPDGVIHETTLPHRVAALNAPSIRQAEPGQSFRSDMPLSELEADAIRDALRKSSGNISKTARRLGISRSTVYRKLQELDLESSAETIELSK